MVMELLWLYRLYIHYDMHLTCVDHLLFARHCSKRFIIYILFLLNLVTIIIIIILILQIRKLNHRKGK